MRPLVEPLPRPLRRYAKASYLRASSFKLSQIFKKTLINGASLTHRYRFLKESTLIEGFWKIWVLQAFQQLCWIHCVHIHSRRFLQTGTWATTRLTKKQSTAQFPLEFPGIRGPSLDSNWAQTEGSLEKDSCERHPPASYRNSHIEAPRAVGQILKGRLAKTKACKVPHFDPHSR